MTVERSEIQLILDQKFTADGQTVLTSPIVCDQWQWFALMYSVKDSGTCPAKSYIRIDTMFVDKNDNRYRLTDANFGCVLEEVTFVDVKRAIVGRCIPEQLMFEVSATGSLSTSNYYTVVLRVQFYKEKPDQ
jgi:hypothetical protein